MTALDVDERQPSTPHGHLRPLRTKAEIDAHDETIEIYVCGVPVKETGKVLAALKKIPNQDSINLQHLRRVAKADYQPQPLRTLLAQAQKEHDLQVSRTCITILEDVPLHAVRINAPTRQRRDVLVQAAQAFQEQLIKKKPGRRRRKSSTPSGQSTPRLPTLVYIFVCATSFISQDDLQALLVQHVPYFSATPPPTVLPPTIYTLVAPRYPPASAQRATAQSTSLWPVTYNPNTSYGPNPAIVLRAQQELEKDGHADRYMALARTMAADAGESGIGESVGVVIVERRTSESTNTSKVVAVAGDARKCCSQTSPSQTQKTGSCNPGAHAVLRAIDFVAQKRRMMATAEIRAKSCSNTTDETGSTYEDSLSAKLASTSLTNSGEPIGVHLLPAPVETAYNSVDDLGIAATYEAQKYHSPLLPLEEHYLSATTNPDSLSPNGYLCLNLEAYITHEPCVMCSMALVHSRIGRVVFEVPEANGALRAEGLPADVKARCEEGSVDASEQANGEKGKLIPIERYGLFYREDLNWRFLAWQWQATNDFDDRHERDDETHDDDGRKTHLALPLNVQV